MTPKALVIIPARLAASRLPNKPLADICGKPMVVHVWERAMEAGVGPVLVACGDQAILDAVTAYGARGVLTDPSLPSGTDRVKVAADFYDPQGEYAYVVNVQGDMPTLDPSLVRQTVEPFKNASVDMATLATPIEDLQELTDPHTVKVALSLREGDSIGRALYFSRNPLPSGKGPYYHHIGLYAYRRECLNRFVSLPVDPLEEQEKLEQLRALANGMRIDAKVVHGNALFGVDTPADLEKARRIMGMASPR
jgi:3-deoxy-manno-octulosonate cytidylyltransferase (CMP-KDO synthetase)